MYRVDYDGPGRLSIMARPHPSAVSVTLKMLRRDRVTAVLSTLMTGDTWPHCATAHRRRRRGRIEFFWWPIPEYGVPIDNRGNRVLALLSDRLRAGEHVVVSCRMALGRSPMIAAALLTELGLSPAAAEEAVSQARGRPVPTLPTQRAWLRDRLATIGS